MEVLRSLGTCAYYSPAPGVLRARIECTQCHIESLPREQRGLVARPQASVGVNLAWNSRGLEDHERLRL